MDNINTLEIDIETFSDIDLGKSGVYRYTESPCFEILLFGYSVNDGPVQVVDLASGEEIPEDIINALTDNNVIKWAHNASFERICLSAWLRKCKPSKFAGYGRPGDFVGNYLDPAGWRCSMVWSAYMGLPLSLKDVGAVLKLEDQKLSEGKDLVRYFCIPCRPTASNGGRTRNMPSDAPADWALFKKYNARDVEVEQSITHRLSKHPVPEFVWDEYHQSEEINDRGIGIDRQLVDSAIEMDARSRQELMDAMREITELENPNSSAQLKEWLCKCGLEMETLGKKEVAAIIKDAPPELQKVLSLRLQLSKSSVKKYQAMHNCVCADGRARGMFFFYGAARSGRWAGRHIQLQNLPQNHLPDLDAARELVRSGDYEAVKILYDDVPDTLSQLIRTAFVPSPGNKFIVSDFSAIEARVLSYIAGEQWRMDLFKNGGDIYCQSASKMFGVPVEKHGINGHLRQKGKIAELACIAEDSPVLTDHGLIPIQNVTTDMCVWDGENWVHHDGVIYRGEREVITYEGLTATPDHLVWIDGSESPIPFASAAASGAHLVQTGNGRTAIRLGNSYFTGKTMEQKLESLLCIGTMLRLWESELDNAGQLTFREKQRLSKLFTAKTGPFMAVEASVCSKDEMRKPCRSFILQLWKSRHKVRISFCLGSRSIHDTYLWYPKSSDGDRSYRHEWQLYSGKLAICTTQDQLHKPTSKCPLGVSFEILAIRIYSSDPEAFKGYDKGRNHFGCRGRGTEQAQELAYHKRTARLYDIRNAGPNHRFTVSNCLVHNCGYGGGVGAMKAMGALDMGLKEDELQPLVDSWRNANTHIVEFWWDVDKAVKEAVQFHSETKTHGICFLWETGMLYITLPSGRMLSYAKPRIGQNKFGGDAITYEGVSAAKKWERIESYGPKFVENITQAIARDVLCYAMRTLKGNMICAHVHDEVIIEADQGTSLEDICEKMGRTPPWVEGLTLRADGYTTEFYKKD